MKTQKGNKLIPIIGKEEFVRDVLIEFAREEDIAPKLLESNFVVEEFEREYFVFLGKVECNYSCSIGYNRTENYVEIEKKQKLIKQSDGSSKWEWVSEPVNKTRTVTDYQAYSGTKNGNTFIVINTNGERNEECWEIEKLIANKSEEFDEEIELDNDIVSKGRRCLGYSFSLDVKYGLPGDTSKDFTSTEKVDVLEVRKYKVPFYNLKYSFNRKEKHFEKNACIKDFSLTLDDDEKEKLKYIPLDTKKAAAEDTSVKKAKRIMKMCWLSIIPAAILSVILPNILPTLTFLGSIITFACFVIAIIATIKKTNKFNGVKAELDKREKMRKQNILNEKHKKVYEILKSVLAKYKLDSATFDEVYSVK